MDWTRLLPDLFDVSALVIAVISILLGKKGIKTLWGVISTWAVKKALQSSKAEKIGRKRLKHD